MAVRAALDGCDAVVHFAGLIDVAESQREPEKYFDFNVDRPTTLLEVMAELGVANIVFSSTAAVYGEPESVPIEEHAAARPVNAYGESKLAYEKKLDEYEASGIRSIRFRYFNVAGALPDGRVGEAHEPETHIIPRVLGAMRDGQGRFEIFGDDYPTPDGTCVRDYIHVMDLAQAHLLGVERLAAGSGSAAFNLGNGNGFSNREVVETCAAVTGTKLEVDIGPRRDGDPAMLVASSEKAKSELGWQPERPDLTTIIEDAWRWHLAHPNGYR
jgi:UDP-glucose 4-epimerase